MPKTITVEETTTIRILSTGVAGAVASLVTQPLEVIKTNRIHSPAEVYHDLHKKIVQKGWGQYMRGSSIAVTRQAYGFTLYTQMLTRLENKISRTYPELHKIFNYSFSSVLAKFTAMVFEAPLTLLKTRVQLVSSPSILEEVRRIMISPLKEYTRGLGTSLAREGLYTLFHYNIYRYLKDDIFQKKFNTKTTFIPAFVAGIAAITVSQPFEVLRNKISLNNFQGSVWIFVGKYFRETGAKGFFVGFVPRLLRKPINSGICWTILESLRHLE